MDTFTGLKGISMAEGASRFQLAHNLLGIILIVVGIFALLAYRYPNKTKLAYVWPVLDLIFTIFLLIFLSVMFGLNNIGHWLWVGLHNNQLLEHTIVLFSIIIGALTVILQKINVLKCKHWLLSWGTSVLIYGFVFMLHPQDQLAGKEALYSVQFHHWCGFVGFITGILFILDIYLGEKVPCLNFLWPTALITNGFMWTFYRINPVAFRSFNMPSFFQLNIVATLALGITLSLAVLLIGALIFKRSK